MSHADDHDEVCAMAALVEARQCGRLGPREIDSLDRHVASCAACAKLARDLESFRVLARAEGATRSLPIDHERGRSRLLRAAATVTPQRSSRRVFFFLPALGATAAILIAFVALRARPAPLLVAEHFPAFATRLETVIETSPGARFDRTQSKELDRVRFDDGDLAASVHPLKPGERFLVVIGDDEVEVRGTIFRLHADGGKLANVRVEEGVVEVRHAGSIARLGAGERWQRPIDPACLDDGKTASVAALPSARPAPVAAVVHHEPTDDGRAFAEGVGLVAKGDYDGAVARLDAFRAQRPDDARAEDAAFLIVLAEKRAGHDDAAAAAARRYLAQYPKGSRRAEAATIANRK